MEKPRTGATVTETTVQRRIPVELNEVLDKFHEVYSSKFGGNNKEVITKSFTDKLFAHMLSNKILDGFGFGKITITPRAKSKGRQFEIDWNINL